MRLYRGEDVETEAGSRELMKEKFPKGKYADVLGLCKVATLAEIEAQGWSLNPGRYVGVAERAADDFEFAVRLEELNEELETLNVEARELEERIAENVASLLEEHLSVHNAMDEVTVKLNDSVSIGRGKSRIDPGTTVPYGGPLSIHSDSRHDGKLTSDVHRISQKTTATLATQSKLSRPETSLCHDHRRREHWTIVAILSSRRRRFPDSVIAFDADPVKSRSSISCTIYFDDA